MVVFAGSYNTKEVNNSRFGTMPTVVTQPAFKGKAKKLIGFRAASKAHPT